MQLCDLGHLWFNFYLKNLTGVGFVINFYNPFTHLAIPSATFVALHQNILNETHFLVVLAYFHGRFGTKIKESR